jgi:hypothetical protein
MGKYPFSDFQDERRENRRPKPVKKQTSIKSLSVNREKQNKEYLRLRDKFLKEHPICQMQKKCKAAPATQIHHQKGRIGELLTDVSYFMACCQDCHAWATLHSKESISLGISISRLKI